MQKINPRRILFIVVAIMLAQTSQAGYGQVLTGLVASSLGGAGQAGVEDGEQFLHNPASIAHGSRFSSALVYQDNVWARHDRDRYSGITLSDNSEDIFAAGGVAYFHRNRALPNLSWEEDFFEIAFGRSVYRYVAMGLALKYRDVEIENGNTDSEFNADIGIHFNPREDFGMGLTFRNILGESDELPDLAQAQDEVALGVNWLYSNILRVRADIKQQLERNPDKKLSWGAGFESLWAQFIILRFGYQEEALREQKYFTAGFGFEGPRLKLDYFFRQDTENSDFSSHGVDLRLPFW